MSDFKDISFHNRELIWFILWFSERINHKREWFSMSHSIDEKLRCLRVFISRNESIWTYLSQFSERLI